MPHGIRCYLHARAHAVSSVVCYGDFRLARVHPAPCERTTGQGRFPGLRLSARVAFPKSEWHDDSNKSPTVAGAAIDWRMVLERYSLLPLFHEGTLSARDF